ncbi:F-box family protein, putative isoform 1 [Hibiscus syriacus]|uniref:F-box family protein, putative isoform 1 n=1 Tax=Hibiscus syriacus TaxID=106335 RepID=A0A6A3CLS2_HIBSY|nr:F-box family protein, putative isoform 1 [Hibiscus syriacus]
MPPVSLFPIIQRRWYWPRRIRLAHNIPAMYELQFAVPMSGAILNNINTRLDGRTISVLLRHCEPKVLFVDTLSCSVALEAISLFPHNQTPPQLVYINDHDDAAVDYRFWCTYESLVEKGDPNFKWIRPKSEWDPIVLNYTSGTTSSPKGVVHSHRGIFTITIDSLIDWEVPKQPVTYGRSRFFMLMGGATLGFPEIKPLENPVKILTAGAPPPAAVLSRTESLGFIVSHGYGLTETAGLVVSCAWKTEEQVAGDGASEVEIEARSENSGVDGSGRCGSQIGTQCETRRKTGGFTPATSALCMPMGYMEIKDRSKDVIISGGENLSSVEVESVLYTHPAINEAAVVARPDEYWGETPCAFVSLKGELTRKPSEQDIVQYCRAKLPHYMVPKTVCLRTNCPRLRRGRFRSLFLEILPRGWVLLHLPLG